MCARILLRQWQDSDFERFAEMNADPEVMRDAPKTLSADESSQWLEELRQEIDDRGWGLWAAEVDGGFAGLTGLAPVSAAFPFGPTVELRWRFRREYRGNAIELSAARDAETFAFQVLKLTELVAFASAENVRSRKLVETLGMVRVPNGDFMHPHLPEGHPRRLHVLYRKTWW